MYNSTAKRSSETEIDQKKLKLKPIKVFMEEKLMGKVESKKQVKAAAGATNQLRL